MRNRFASFGRALAAWLMIMSAVSSQAMTVQPVIVDLSTGGSRMSAVVTVENTFATALPVELRAVEADFNETGLVTTTREAADLLIFPPQALIPPGRTQAFRVQWVGDPGLAQSKHFFLTVAQLPVKLPAGQSAVQILYNFQVIVSVGVAGVRPAVKVISAGSQKGEDGKLRLVLNLQNDATTYGYLSDGSLRISQKDASGKEIFRQNMTPAEVQQQVGYGLVGAGQKRKLLTPVVMPDAGGTIDVEFSPRSGR